MKKILMAVIALGMMSTIAQATCVAGSCTGKVEKLYMTTNGTLYVEITGDKSKLNCTPPGGVYMSLVEGDAGKNAMYSLLLTTKTTKQDVTVRVVEGSSNCKVAYVKAVD